jgi:hypothetical protein
MNVVQAEAVVIEQASMYDITVEKAARNFTEVSAKMTGHYSDFKHFAYKVFADDTIVHQYIESCIFRVMAGGNNQFMSKSKVDNEVVFTAIAGIPFHCQATCIAYDVLNMQFDQKKLIAKDNSPTITKNLSDTICEYRKLRAHSKINFAPYLIIDRTDPDILNIFQGFRFPYAQSEVKYDEGKFPITTGSTKLWVDHILHVICDGDKEHAKTFLSWLAHIIQKPQDKGFSVIIKSDQGAGKSILYDFISRVIGVSLCLQLPKIQDLVEKHNKNLEARMIVCLNECMDFPTPAMMQIVKSFSTDKQLPINPKGQACYTIDNYARLLVTTNNMFSMIITTDDRRFFCLKASGSRIGDVKYFDALVDSLENAGDQQEFFNFLSNYDITGFRQMRPPMTPYKRFMIGDQAKGVVSFVRELCENKIRNIDSMPVHGLIPLYDLYTAWTLSAGGKTVSRKIFANNLQETFKLEPDRHMINGVRCRGIRFNRDEIKPLFIDLFKDPSFEYDMHEPDEQ